MTNFLKLASVSAIAIALTACATTDDKFSVGVDDNDKYASSKDGTDTELSDAQTFGMDDDDKFEAKSEGVMFGGAMMYPNKTIVENASAANNLTTLVALVKQAQLVETLSSDGPFTVFAPTDTAFSYVPAETTSALMQDENREMLQGVLTYHVVPGRITAADLMNQIKANGGSYTATTVAGSPLTFRVMDGKVKVADANGTLSTVTNADVMQSNGVVHVVNSVLMPK